MLKLPKRKILRQNRDFQRVYRYGKSYANKYLVLYVLVSDQLPGKVGFAAGKKLGNAVVRNRVKRLLRESYRKHQGKLKGDACILLVGRQSAVGLKCGEMEHAFLALGRRAKIFREDAK